MPELKGDEGRISGGGLLIDLSARQVSLHGNPVRLTATEWVLLTELARNEGRVVSQQRLVDRLWGGEAFVDTSALRTYVGRLRAKLGDDPNKPRLIFTERGSGYRFIRPG
jgi:two-component system KDP operon response regulator KdpE